MAGQRPLRKEVSQVVMGEEHQRGMRLRGYRMETHVVGKVEEVGREGGKEGRASDELLRRS